MTSSMDTETDHSEHIAMVNQAKIVNIFWDGTEEVLENDKKNWKKIVLNSHYNTNAANSVSNSETTTSFWELLTRFGDEIRSYKKFFNLNDCAEALLLKLFLPANDLISDFLVAEKWFKSDNDIVCKWFTFFAYYFIACPGLMFLIANIGMIIDKICSSRCQGSVIPFLVMLFLFTTEAFLLVYADPRILFPVAIFVSSAILMVGVMAVFFHGPCMKQISNLVTGYEGRFESAPQFFMHLVLLMAGQEYFQTSGLEIYGLCTSLVMLGKDLAESILMHGPHNSLQNKALSSKIYAMGKIFPVIILTAIFRLGTLALAIHHIFVVEFGFLLVPLKLIIMLPPAMTILCLRSYSPHIQDLSVIECFMGIIEELSTFAIWGKLRSEGSRWIQFGFTIYFGILYGGYCLWTIFNPLSPHAELYAVTFLCCGWVAFPLYIIQIFLIDSKIISENRESSDIARDGMVLKRDELDYICYI